jgi:hypothetical protein
MAGFGVKAEVGVLAGAGVGVKAGVGVLNIVTINVTKTKDRPSRDNTHNNNQPHRKSQTRPPICRTVDCQCR